MVPCWGIAGPWRPLHQILIHTGSGLAALGDGIDDEGLAAGGVTGVADRQQDEGSPEAQSRC